MRQVIEISGFKNSKIDKRYFLKDMSVVVNGEMREFLYICQEDEPYAKPTLYSDYFLDRVLGHSLLNSAINTRKNAHGRHIVAFLNYIFFDCKDVITDIKQLKIEHIEDFLEEHSRGNLKKQKNGWKSKDTANEAGRAITRFVYWLNTARICNGKTLGLKYIKSSMFEKKTYSIKSEFRDKNRVKETLEVMANFQTSNITVSREKVVAASMFTIKCLMDIARKHDPIMVLGIALGAFVGLRQGEVVQMHSDRIHSFSPFDILQGCYLDLKNDALLRSDGIYTGKIKVKRKQPVYEAFLPILEEAYKNHKKLLSEIGQDGNIFGALFIDNNGLAMTSRTYCNRFEKLVNILNETLLNESLKGNVYAIKDYNILLDSNYKLTPHSLRHFYTQTIDSLEKNLIVVQYYRGDKNINTQEQYKGNMSSLDGIKSIMESIQGELCKYGFKSM